ncbi:MAG: biotin carboxylase N-terminal domain-containing protein [Spongiibacteraceae bacterium]|jgi:acetyl/propionyl-CoA carboxylase alpha subunit|nr:biotin carboxylase N-terminal domain-containing protein [Spongiibacteraceae bacterium]
MGRAAHEVLKVKATNKHYLHNPLIHSMRKLSGHASEWVRSFSCEDVRPLIICRGPIRKEAMDVFDEMGIHTYGILLSEKDSITYTNALAPELRKLTDPHRVHRVPDYSGASKEERVQRIQQIVAIAHDNGYNAIFAGYGFMAEDEEMVSAMEKAGLNFIGPCSHTVHAAGLKDEAKRTALEVGVSTTPGVDNLTVLTLLAKYPDLASLVKLCKDQRLAVDASVLDDAKLTLEEKAVEVLAASYQKGVDLFSIDELGAELKRQLEKMFAGYMNNRVRLKAISGGGGKGQRIMAAPASYSGSDAEKIKQAAARGPELLREILAEVKCNGVGDNKNVLLELNIETTRHQEIQVVGNGDWCITMGGRDCSLQMHEQKLLEVSVTVEELAAAIEKAEQQGRSAEAKTLRTDLEILKKMETEAARFGQAVGLDSVSTFECIVDGESHFFMEMNTRIQVEHRVTELCYKLRFSNPANPAEHFVVTSLVEAMVLLARHGKRLPRPERLPREGVAVEARLNATNQALQPHAGGVIEYWSNAIAGEIRDDQGISMHNPDTDVFMKYHLAGAYDSNIALLLTVGEDRLDSYQRLSEILRCTELRGKDLATNLQFHYGLVNWFIGQNVNARPSTRFIVPYLTAVGELRAAAEQIDLNYAYAQLRGRYLARADAASRSAWAQVLDRKQGLLLRPLERLAEEPHMLSGWLSVNRHNFRFVNGHVEWLKNPLEILDELYRFLNMDHAPGKPAAYMIWADDHTLLQTGLSFYESLRKRLGLFSFADINSALLGACPKDFDAADWEGAQAAHAGYQAGSEILSLLPTLARQTDFFALKVNDDLSLTIPDRLTDTALQTRMAKVLVPPPAAKSDEILASSGGMFYPREAPGMDPFVEEGSHFEAGQPLYIVEVMKMFNKVYAPFSGTIDKVLMEGDGVIIKKGQPLFKITPDETIVVESPEDIKARRRKATDAFLATL